MIKLNEKWVDFLEAELESESFKQTLRKLKSEIKAGKIIFPPPPLILNAFNLCPLNSLKIVLLGQDPYHGENQAMGLSFSVNLGVGLPPSLKNIFKEMQNDLGIYRNNGDLSDLARQGVLMLNSVLSVEKNLPTSHASFGWQDFTDAIIRKISKEFEGIIFLLWGNFAIKKAGLIDTKKHFILKAAHPSPLARGAFFGCKHFSKANQILKSLGKTPIIWG